MNEKGYIGTVVAVVMLAFGVIIMLSAIGTAMGIITLPWFKLNTQVQTNRDIITKTYDANNVIYNYEWFKQTSEDIKAAEQQTTDAKVAVTSFEASAGADRSKWGFEDKTEDARLRAVAQGLQNHYTQLVADYNAHASEANRSIFQNNLPTFFSLNPF